MVARGVVVGLAAGAEGIHRRQWLLQRARPHRHGAVMEMPSLPAEGLRFLPGTTVRPVSFESCAIAERHGASSGWKPSPVARRWLFLYVVAIVEAYPI